MNLQHIVMKIFVDGELAIETDDLVKVLHRWISEQSLPDLLIDVADYMHIPKGPGIVLIGLEADYSLDFSQGQAGLCYHCKIKRDGSSQDNLRQAFDAVVHACDRLESELPGLKFDRTRLQIAVNDRAIAPNNEESRERYGADIRQFVTAVGGEAKIEFEPDARRRFGATAELANAFQSPAPSA